MRIYDEKTIYKVLEAAGFASVVCHAEKEKHWLCILAKK